MTTGKETGQFNGTDGHAGATLVSDEIQLWPIVFPARDDPPPEDLAVLDADERERAARFVRKSDRAVFVARRSWLRRLLAYYLGMPAAQIGYRHGANGKPVLTSACNSRDLHFSLSHSNGFALCAIAAGESIGVDVERVRAIADYRVIARRHFGPREFAIVHAAESADAPQVFFDCWTRKEAFIKATGEGLSRALDSFDVALDEPVRGEILESSGDGRPWYVYRLDPAPDVAAALCCRMPAARLRWRRREPGLLSEAP